MNEQENVALVKQALAAFGRRDLQAFLHLFSEDAEFRHPMSTAIWPWAGLQRGRSRIAEAAAGVTEVLEFEQFEPRECIAQGDTVVVLVFERVRSKATGRVVDNDYVHVYTVRDGKIIRFCVYEDTAPVIAALRDQDAI
jgi:ketosteroid isomerase-like protein